MHAYGQKDKKFCPYTGSFYNWSSMPSPPGSIAYLLQLLPGSGDYTYKTLIVIIITNSGGGGTHTCSVLGTARPEGKLLGVRPIQARLYAVLKATLLGVT